jgi:hypothetical protein
VLQWIASLSFLELVAWYAGGLFVTWLPLVIPWPETPDGQRRLGSFIAAAAIAFSLVALAT